MLAPLRTSIQSDSAILAFFFLWLFRHKFGVIFPSGEAGRLMKLFFFNFFFEEILQLFFKTFLF